MTKTMARVCALCGKGNMAGFNVSHSNRHTKRRWKPNLFKKKLPGARRAQFVCAKCLKAISKIRSSRAGGPPET